ncbi:unnamed protein product [Bursaphelenchus xylophilus]|uniref:(pine wood nematode) hypothetical protein n=1 Tax=Bursaphelenchus xylophilus TaxID=6326 RepID=A0A1I7RKE5_BURXY|nr:unnamed protein product [Bursaphelenchus xylophilus]CAG9131363.1 unnamed protein product [Bursaphelenchus xylophilus]
MKVFLLILHAATVASFEIPVQRSSREFGKAAYGMALDMDKGSLSYIGTVSLGTPLQDFNVAFDFTTPVFWVPDAVSTCGVDVERPASCENKNLFDRGKSRTFNSEDVTTNLSFLNLTIKTELAADSFRFAPHYRAGFNARKNIKFGLVKQFNGQYNHVRYDGVFGLGLGEQNGLTSPIKQMAEQGAIPAPILSAYLLESRPKNDFDGVFTLGAIDEMRCEAVDKFAEILKDGNWAFRSPSFRVPPNNEVENGSWTGVLDLKTDFIHMPRPAVTLLDQSLGANIDDQGQFLVNCGADLSMEFVLGGTNIRFRASELYEDYSGDTCLLKVKATAPGDRYNFRFGTPILRKHCVVFDFSGGIAFPKKKN